MQENSKTSSTPCKDHISIHESRIVQMGFKTEAAEQETHGITDNTSRLAPGARDTDENRARHNRISKTYMFPKRPCKIIKYKIYEPSLQKIHHHYDRLDLSLKSGRLLTSGLLVHGGNIRRMK